MLICSDRICPALRGLALSYSDLQAFAQQCSALLGVARPYSDRLDVAHFPRRLQLLAFARAWLTVLGVSWTCSELFGFAWYSLQVASVRSVSLYVAVI